MTTQTNLDLIWASTGGVTDPGDVKYATGWVAEIPTFQNFNFVLTNHSKNQLALAEKGYYTWEATINYEVGVQAMIAGVLYTCVVAHLNQDPSLDTTHSYWTKGYSFGSTLTSFSNKKGLSVDTVNTKLLDKWDANELSTENTNAVIALNTSAATDNHLIANVKGELVTVNVGNVSTPDGRSIDPVLGDSDRLFHEGHPPTQSEVAGTIPANPSDGSYYGRKDGNWVKVTHIISDEFPPQAERGEGAGWFNLAEGQLYVDINDGDSSQWVPASPAANEPIHRKLMEETAIVLAMVYSTPRFASKLV